MTDNETSNSIEERVNEAVKWTLSSDGKSEIKKAFAQAEKTSAKYKTDQFVDQKSLDEPVTI